MKGDTAVADEDLKMIEPLLESLKASGKKYDFEKIKTAFLYADEMHKGQKRLSGDPYITHPIAVAESVAGLGLDTDSICAAFLHDTVEDCPDKTDLDKIRELFGDEVALLVDGVTKIKSINIEDKEEEHIENIRKMLLAMSSVTLKLFVTLPIAMYPSPCRNFCWICSSRPHSPVSGRRFARCGSRPCRARPAAQGA